MKIETMIDYILTNGNVNQKYIIKRDIYKQNIKSPEMLSLQQEIINSKSVKKMLKSQNEDGWFGVELHGNAGKAMDSTVMYLRQIGVEPNNDFMIKAFKAFLLDKNPYGTITSTRIGFDRGYNFSNAAILAALHIDSNPVHEKLHQAYERIMEIFENGSKVEGLDEISKECTQKRYIGHRVFLKDKYLPWVSDIQVLALSDAWKNERTCEIVDDAMQNIGRLMPIPNIYEPFNGHYLGTIGNYLSLNNDNPFELPFGDIVWWIRIMQNLTKITDVSSIPYFKHQLDVLFEYVEQDKLISSLSESALKAFEKFYSFENKWKTETQKFSDIYFQFLIIITTTYVPRL